MSLSLGTADIPGGRIGHYRNSAPRRIRLLGLGEAGGKVARAVAKRGLSNVEVMTNAKPVGWDEVAGDQPGERSNMIVIVCAQGDERLFRPERGKPDMLVTFVLLQSAAEMPAAGDERVADARGFSDLFVTTSDADYVAELIDNLAS
ncbi:MAG: hypothetical protein QOG83_3777 [Alphaproteobacteria bacterium]|nr:hypothetical protein [Alphaproteobacteria bacterium]